MMCQLDLFRLTRHYLTCLKGGLKVINFAALISKKPEQVIEKAVWGMIPHNRLGRSVIKKLRVYRGPNHPHAAQSPEVWEMC
jgi:large subunit ribosomal protein L13